MAVNDEVIADFQNSCAIFNYSFQLDSYYFNVVQLTDTEYDIKINNNFFRDIIQYEISGDLKKSKNNLENNFFDVQNLNTNKLENVNNAQNIFEENKNNINQFDFFSNDNGINNQLEIKNNPLSFINKDKKNKLKENENLKKHISDNQIFNDNNNIDANKDDIDYPSFSEL